MNALVDNPSPVSTLPEEVLGAIMKLSLGETEDEASPPSSLSTMSTAIALTHVSSLWRAVGISVPHLWNRLVVNVTSATPINKDRLLTVLERSQPLPLTVVLTVTPFRGYLQFGAQETRNILAINALKSRLRTLRLYITRTMFHSWINPALPHQSQMSHLAEEIQIVLLSDSNEPDSAILGGSGGDEPTSTMLRRLSIVSTKPTHLDRQMDIHDLHLSFDTSQLTHLNLRTSQFSCDDVLKLLGNSPNLSSLAFSLAGRYMEMFLSLTAVLAPGDFSPRAPPLTHSRLQELDIEVYCQDTVTTLAELFERLTTPMLSVLRVVSVFPYSYYHRALLDSKNIEYLYRSPELATLRIVGTGMTDIREALASCSALQTLYVEACPRRFLKSCLPQGEWRVVEGRKSRCDVTEEDLKYIFARLEGICRDVASSSPDIASIKVEMVVEDPETGTKTSCRSICKRFSGTRVGHLRSVDLTLHLSSMVDCSRAPHLAEGVRYADMEPVMVPEIRPESYINDSDGDSIPDLKDVESDSDAADSDLFSDSDSEDIPALEEVLD